MKSNFKVLLFYIVLIAGIILAVVLLFGSQANDAEPKYSDIREYISDATATYVYNNDNNQPKPDRLVEISSAELTEKYELTLKLTVDGTEKKISYAVSSVVVKDLVELLTEYSDLTGMKFEPEPEKIMPWWVSFLPYIIIIIVFVLV